MADLQIEVQKLELVDGEGKVPSRMTKASPLSTQCEPGQHCAHHGSDPFFCCRCAAEFKPA
jgi:hypothetical protein